MRKHVRGWNAEEYDSGAQLTMLGKAAEFLMRLKDLAKECNVDIKRTDSDDVLMVPTYKRDGSLDEWFVVGINPYRQYGFTVLTQETQ